LPRIRVRGFFNQIMKNTASDITKRLFNRHYKQKKIDPKLPDARFRSAVARYFLKGRSLDLGAGDGRHVLFLASKGYEVVAVDFSRVAANHLRKHVRNQGDVKNVQVKIADIRETIPSVFSNIYTNYTLHFLPKTEWMKVIRKMQKQTCPGGVNLIEDFSESPSGNVPKKGYAYIQSKDLQDLYKAWDVLRSSPLKVKTMVPNGRGGFRKAESFFFVARKPR